MTSSVGRGLRVVAAVHLDRLAHGEERVDAGRLQHDPDPLLQRLLALRRVVPEDLDASPPFAADTPRGSRWSSSCRRRSGRGARRPRRGRRADRCRRPPPGRRRTCAARRPRSRARPRIEPTRRRNQPSSSTWLRSGSPATNRPRLSTNTATTVSSHPSRSPQTWGETITSGIDHRGESSGSGSSSKTSSAAPAIVPSRSASISAASSTVRASPHVVEERASVASRRTPSRRRVAVVAAVSGSASSTWSARPSASWSPSGPATEPRTSSSRAARPTASTVMPEGARARQRSARPIGPGPTTTRCARRPGRDGARRSNDRPI